MQNPFDNPGFSMASLTAINIIPNRYGRIEHSTSFRPNRCVPGRSSSRSTPGAEPAADSMPPGSPGTVGERGKRTVRSFVIPHIPHDDVVLPEEVQGIRAFGSETEMDAMAGVMARHLETMRNKHAITLEHLRMGALKGQILDADGSTIYDLYDEFGMSPATVGFDLAVANSDIKKQCATMCCATIEDNLKGEFMTGVHVLCSPEFFRCAHHHAKVKDAYTNWQQGPC
jgi:hypothetical protein